MSQPPPDSYLLSHLRSDEHELIRQLLAVLDTLAQASLLAMATCAAPVSNTSIALFETLAGAKNALARYADWPKTWEVDLVALKSHEDGVARGARPGDSRDACAGAHAGGNRGPRSARRLVDGHRVCGSPGVGECAGRAEDGRRAAAEGRSAETRERCQAMVDIGKAWMETGSAGLLMLKELGSGEADDDALYTSNLPQLSVSNASTLVNDDPADAARPRHVSFDTRTPPLPSPTPTLSPSSSHRVRPLLRRLTHIFRRAPSPAFPGVEFAPADTGRMTGNSTWTTDMSERTTYTAESENTHQSNTSRASVQIVPYTPPGLRDAS